jgi:hypothetical protein
VKNSYNLSFTLVWSRHYSNSQEATKYSYWIAFISSFSVLLAEKKLAGHKNSKCVSKLITMLLLSTIKQNLSVTDIFHESRVMVNLS